VVEGVAGRPLTMLGVGVVRTPADAELGHRLVAVEQGIEQWLDEHRPECVAVERVFSQHNVRTVMGTAQAGAVAVLVAARAGLPVLRARIEPVRRRGLKRKPYLAFAGIAEPRKFYASLAAAGGTIGFTMDFADHHLFSDADCEAILAEAKHRDLVPITTEKDRVRLYGRAGAAERLANSVETFPVRVRFDEPKRLETLIGDAVAAHAGVYRRRRFIAGAPEGEQPKSGVR
jgi:hypothetical protein